MEELHAKYWELANPYEYEKFHPNPGLVIIFVGASHFNGVFINYDQMRTPVLGPRLVLIEHATHLCVQYSLI